MEKPRLGMYGGLCKTKLRFEETLERHRHRPLSQKVGEVHMKKWWREKDFLLNIREIILTKDMSQDSIVETIYRDISD